MAKVNIPYPPHPAEGEALERWLARLVDELQYILCNLDQDNMTSKYNER